MCGLVLDTITKLLKMAEDRQRVPYARLSKNNAFNLQFFFKENGQSCNFIVWFFYCLVAGHTVHVENKINL